MASQFPIHIRTDLDRPLMKYVFRGAMFSKDNKAHVIDVTTYNNNQVVPITGTVEGVFRRNDGKVIGFEGSVSGGKAVIELPDSAYEVDGPLTVLIRNSDNGVNTVIGYMSAYVNDSGNAEYGTGGTYVISIAEIQEKLDELDPLIARLDALDVAELSDLEKKFEEFDAVTTKTPYIHANMKSLNTTNYIAVAIPSSVLVDAKNTLSFKCYCKDDVAVYVMMYTADLSQTGNSRLVTRLVGQSYTEQKTGNWYTFESSNFGGTLPEFDNEYVALVFNMVRKDDTKTITEAYFSEITMNGTLINDVINQVFLYSASPTVNDWVALYSTSTMLGRSGSYLGTGKILCIGDSLTAGVYASDSTAHEENYPYFMKQIIANESINKGMPGYSASMYWNNSALSGVDFTDVLHIIIMLGTNGGLTDTLDTDVFPYTDYADYANTKTGCYCKIIEYCMKKAPNAQIYLCTTPFYNKDIVPQFAPPTTPNANAVIPKIAEYYNFPIIDVRHGMGINQKNTLTFQTDGLHGDSEFYQKMGTFIGSQLKANACFVGD